jgi:adenosylcobinamide-GDP ribazoletransferase
MKQFLIALQFLTVLPIKIKSEIKEKDFGTSLLYFPVIGILIGLVLSAAVFTLGVLPNLVVGVVILILSIVITGGIHLDGFADTCDGFYGSKPKEKILEIMRDSRVGTMGVVGVVCLLLLKFTLIVSIPQKILWKVLIMMAVFARWSQVLACYTSKYARKEGKAEYFIEYAGKKEFFIGILLTSGLFFLLMQMKGMILFVISMFPTMLFIHCIKRKIGGMTGDTIGAVNEIAEVLILLFYLFLLNVNI